MTAAIICAIDSNETLSEDAVDDRPKPKTSDIYTFISEYMNTSVAPDSSTSIVPTHPTLAECRQ